MELDQALVAAAALVEILAQYGVFRSFTIDTVCAALPTRDRCWPYQRFWSLPVPTRYGGSAR